MSNDSLLQNLVTGSDMSQLPLFQPLSLSNIPSQNHQLTPKTKHTPLWMIKMDSLLTSDIRDREQFTEVFGWVANYGRESYGLSGTQAFTSSAIQHSDVIIRIAGGAYHANLDNKMNRGEVINVIEIVRLGNNKQEVQNIKFEKCYIKIIQQVLDDLVIVFGFQKRTNTIFQYSKDDASKQGQTVSVADYRENTVEG